MATGDNDPVAPAGAGLHTSTMAALERMAGDIAHDLNNLLMVVGASLDMLERGRDPERRIAAIRAAVDRGEALTERLLAFSGRHSTDLAVLDLGSALRALEGYLRERLGEGIDLAIDLDDGLWRVLAEAGAIEPAILNLADNARDAMPDGGRILIEARNREGGEDNRAGEGPEDDFVRVTVTDTGQGMSPDVLARAFEPLFTTKKPARATGLGLSQVYGYARRSGGTVTAQSRPGEGTTITIDLPRALAEPN